MEIHSSAEVAKAERDPRFFVWLPTFVVAGIYVATLVTSPAARRPVTLVVFTALTAVHGALHWQLGRIIGHRRKEALYVLGQGLLAFGILLITGNLIMIYMLFMVLVGEAIGLFGLTRRGLMATGVMLALMAVNLSLLPDWEASGRFATSVLPLVVLVVLFVGLYMRQIEAREQVQALAAELDAANRQLAEYATHIEELTLAAERQRMARELHDVLSQGVAGLVLQLEAVKAHLEAGRTERAREIIEHAMARARGTLADSRASIADLRTTPASVQEAMRERVDRFTEVTGIPCDLTLDVEDFASIQSLGEHLLRVLNESLANVTRHAQAGQVWVGLEATDNRLELAIEDDGQGFDPEKTMAAGHYGLLGIRERARLMGGTLEIDSASGSGTRVRLLVPIVREQ